jgi:hypothetical protein
MAALTPVDAAISIGQRIGRYFALVSVVPSLFLVLWTYILIASRATSGKSAVHNVEAALSHWSPGKVTGIILLSFAISMVLHPLQFVTTQLLEGYWGTTRLAVAAMKLRIVHHRKRQRSLRDKAGDDWDEMEKRCLQILRKQPGYRPEWETESDSLDGRIAGVLKSKNADDLMGYLIAQQEALDHADRYPADARRILPTQLGNALRRFEDSGGEQYGLNAITIAPHLYLIAPDRHRNYLMDAREDMDTSIRICTVGLAATVLTICFFLTKGLWLLWALLPYFISYLAYRGAVSAAQGYGSVVTTVIDLNRFRLYNELGLDLPRDSAEERENNEKLMLILSNSKNVDIRYRPRDGLADSK